MGIPPEHPAIRQAIEKGLMPAPKAAPVEPHKVLAAAFVPPATWVVGAEVPSIANDRDWRTRNRVAQVHRKAVSRAFGPHLRELATFAEHLHGNGVVRVTLTRLGGRALDKWDNLPASCKYVLDTVCLFFGVDDADPRLDVKHLQEPGGPTGVRIQLEAC